MKKILITGGTGFIGSHLAEFFVKKKFKVTVYDKYNSNNNFGWIESSLYKNKIKVILGDVCDFKHLDNIIKENNFVIHLAALISIPYSYLSPSSFIDTNIIGTYNVLESCKINKIKKVITTSTSEVYGSGLYFPIDENHPIQTQSPYSATKASADNLSISYQKSFNLPVTVIRPFNVYGPRQSDRAIIPTIIGQLISSQKKLKLGNLKSQRDYTYVEDLCDAYYNIIKNKKKCNGEILNTGSGKNFSINEIIKKISNMLRIKKPILMDSQRLRPAKSEVNILLSSTKKINYHFGWRATTSFDSGLKKTIKWFLKNNSHLNSNNYRF